MLSRLVPGLLCQYPHDRCCTKCQPKLHHHLQVTLFRSSSAPYHTMLHKSNKVPYCSKALQYLCHITAISCKTLERPLANQCRNDRQQWKQSIQHYYYQIRALICRVRMISWSHSTSRGSWQYLLAYLYQTYASFNLIRRCRLLLGVDHS